MKRWWGWKDLNPRHLGFPSSRNSSSPEGSVFIDYDILEPNVIATRPQPRQQKNKKKQDISLPPPTRQSSKNGYCSPYIWGHRICGNILVCLLPFFQLIDLNQPVYPVD